MGSRSAVEVKVGQGSVGRVHRSDSINPMQALGCLGDSQMASLPTPLTLPLSFDVLLSF